MLNCFVPSIIFFSEIISSLKTTNLINNSGVNSNRISNSLSVATKIFDEHQYKEEDFPLSTVFQKKPSNTVVGKVMNNLSIAQSLSKRWHPNKSV